MSVPPEELNDETTKPEKLNDDESAADKMVNAFLGEEEEEEKEKWISLDFIKDVPMRVIVELGRTELSLKDLLVLDKGSTIELNKLAGEPLEFLVSGKIAAKGEVVVINEKFGIRLTDIIDPNAKSVQQM